MAFRSLSPTGLAVVIKDFQLIDLDRESFNDLLSFPDMSIQDMLWEYSDLESLRSNHWALRQIASWFRYAELNSRKFSRRKDFTNHWRRELRVVAIDAIQNLTTLRGASPVLAHRIGYHISQNWRRKKFIMTGNWLKSVSSCSIQTTQTTFRF